jgi:hypothetical protein
VRMKKAHERRHHRYAETIRHSLRDGVTAYSRALLGVPGLIASVACRIAWSQRRGIRTTRLCRPRRPRTPCETCTSIASRSNVCGDWPNAPPGGNRTVPIGSYFSEKRKTNIFAMGTGHVGQISDPGLYAQKQRSGPARFSAYGAEANINPMASA